MTPYTEAYTLLNQIGILAIINIFIGLGLIALGFLMMNKGDE